MVAKGAAKPIQKDGVEYLQAEKVVTKVRINHAQIAVDDNDRQGAGKLKKKNTCYNFYEFTAKQ